MSTGKKVTTSMDYIYIFAKIPVKDRSEESEFEKWTICIRMELDFLWPDSFH